MPINQIPPSSHLIIIGAMKCGTTSLFDYLSIHPSICPAVVKEPGYFSDSPIHKYPAKAFEELFKFQTDQHKYTLEASTNYTKYPLEKNVPRKIYEYGIRPKFIYIVRNPFTRIESQYNYISSIYDPDTPLTSPTFVSLSNYYLQIMQYMQYFQKTDFLILSFEQLSRDPIKTMEETCRFLDIENIYRDKSFKTSNKTQQPISLREKRLRELSPTQFLIESIPASVKPALRKVLNKFRPRTKKLTAEERSVIHNELSDDMQRLSKVFNINVKEWGF